MQEKYSNIITDFLRDHPLISVKALESELNIPQSTIGQAMAGNRSVPAKHIFPILCLLSKYGLGIDGYSLSYDETDSTLSGRKFVETINDVEEDGCFAYIVKEYRFIASDYFDLM